MGTATARLMSGAGRIESAIPLTLPSPPFSGERGIRGAFARMGRGEFEARCSKRQAGRPIRAMGATRTRCVKENGKPPMPFGWLLLTLESTETP